MNCEHLEDLFSARFDGDLANHERDAFDAHMANCQTCNGAWAEFQSAVGTLRNVARSETTPELHAATLAAVAGAGPAVKPRPRRRTLQLLLAAFGGAAAAMLLAWLLFGFGGKQTLAIALDNTIVALQRGETHTAAGLVVSRSASGELSVRALPVAPVIIDRVVEVPVEVTVEVPVDRIVEVPVEVEVTRVPLFTIDTSTWVAALGKAAKELGAGMHAMAAANRAAAAARQTDPSQSGSRPPTIEPRIAPSLAAATDDASASNGASLRVRKVDGRMTLETSGTLEELVPALLAQLTTPDVELQSLIQRQLASIHELATADPSIRSQLAAMPNQRYESTDDEPELFGATKDPQPADPPAVAWAAWWHANATLIAQSPAL